MVHGAAKSQTWLSNFHFHSHIIYTFFICNSKYYPVRILLYLLFCKLPFWRRQWQPTPVLLPGKSHGQRSLVGSPSGCPESDTTKRLHFHFSLSCIGEGNGNPLQCSCLENPRDGGAWWAAVYGVAQSQTRLKRLSSSSSSRKLPFKQSLVMNIFHDMTLFDNPVIISHRALLFSCTMITLSFGFLSCFNSSCYLSCSRYMLLSFPP